MNQLPNKAPVPDPVLQGVIERNESYLSTIYALQAFIRISKKYCESKDNVVNSSIGRRMNFASDSKKKPCTPDLILQVGEAEGLVGEAKLQICENIDNRWEKYLKQLRKYDNELVGWWTPGENLNHKSLIFITEIAYSAPLESYIKERISNNSFNLKRSFALVEFDKRQRSIEFLFLRIKYGLIDNPTLNKELQKGIDTPYERLVFETKEKKFYDAKPQDIEYTMVYLWQNIFNRLVHEEDSKGVVFKPESKIWEVSVNIEELTKLSQKTSGSEASLPREAEYPQISLIREALDKFVSIGMGKKGSNTREYTIFFKKYRSPLEKFVYISHKKKRGKTNNVLQMDLFKLEDDKVE